MLFYSAMAYHDITLVFLRMQLNSRLARLFLWCPLLYCHGLPLFFMKEIS